MFNAVEQLSIAINRTDSYGFIMKKMILVAIILFTAIGNCQQYDWVKVAQLPHALTTVDFVDSLHGWTADNVTGFYYTRDGGLTWQQGSGATVVPYSISMHDTLIGWAAGWGASAGAVHKTTDGGVSWHEQLFVNNRHYLSTTALTPKKNVTIGRTVNFAPDTGKIVRTTNGGTTWNEQTRMDSENVAGFNKIFFLDSTYGWVSGGINNIGTAVWRTTNGGATWSFVLAPRGFYALSFIDTVRGWGAYSSTIYHTTDGGLTWQFQWDVQDTLWGAMTINAVSFLDSLNGWAFGDIFYQGIISEGIFRTTNGGNNWFRESIGLTGDFGGVDDAKMLDRRHGWAVCADGSVLRYQITTGVVEKLPDLPKTFSLSQNYPNPFNPTTTMEYEILHRGHVQLFVRDELGREISTVVNQNQEPGKYRVHFNGNFLPSGVYYYTLTTSSITATRQMMLIK